MDQLTTIGSGDRGLFDKIRRINSNGVEYWTARDLMECLEYSEWRNFTHVIEKAKASCQKSGNEPQYHFVDDNKLIATANGAKRKVRDIHLSRFACFLIAQNGSPTHRAIAEAQKYFAIQTRRQELSDIAVADQERIELRDQCTREFKDLSGAARQVGVNDRNFGLFHDAGYKGLYDGLGCEDIKAKKGIPAKDGLMDRMGTTELAANSFRLTQAREKLQGSSVTSEQQAFRINRDVGQEVRAAIKRIGGTMPENLPPAEHIKEAKKRIKKAVPKIQLDDSEAKGLVVEQKSDLSDL